MITDKAALMTEDCEVAMILGIYEENYWEVDETNNRRIIGEGLDLIPIPLITRRAFGQIRLEKSNEKGQL